VADCPASNLGFRWKCNTQPEAGRLDVKIGVALMLHLDLCRVPHAITVRDDDSRSKKNEIWNSRSG
jgi:hypothetical protein